MSKYDPVLNEYLSKLKTLTENSEHKKHLVTYLSTQNEFIRILANEQKSRLVAEIIDAKYYGIMFNSTHNIYHID